MRVLPKVVFPVLVLLFCSSLAFAKLPPKIAAVVASNYPAAVPHKAMETAYEQPDSSKMRGYVVIERGGLAAERASFYISWSDYDYRDVTVHADKGGEISTRGGSPYTYLQRGDVMAVVDVGALGRTVYFKLMSADIYIPENKVNQKHHSRVTLTLAIVLPQDIVKEDDPQKALDLLSSWIKPFTNRDEAFAYAKGISDEKHTEAQTQAPTSVDKIAQKVPDKKMSDEEIKKLEKRIDAAKKEMEQAQEEVKKLKSK